MITTPTMDQADLTLSPAAHVAHALIEAAIMMEKPKHRRRILRKLAAAVSRLETRSSVLSIAARKPQVYARAQAEAAEALRRGLAHVGA